MSMMSRYHTEKLTPSGLVFCVMENVFSGVGIGFLMKKDMGNEKRNEYGPKCRVCKKKKKKRQPSKLKEDATGN